MVVALGALKVQPQEQLGGAGGHLLRGGVVGLKVEGGSEFIFGRGQEQPADQVVVAQVLGEARAEPLLQRHGVADPLLLGPIGQDAVAPRRGHVGRVARRGEQTLDELPAFFGPLVGAEFADLGGAGDHADEIERRAAEELGVAGRVGGLDLGVGPALGEELVDAARHLEVILRRSRRGGFCH